VIGFFFQMIPLLTIDLIPYFVALFFPLARNDFTGQRQAAICLRLYGQFWDSCRDRQTSRFMDGRPLLSTGQSATGLPVVSPEIRTRPGFFLKFKYQIEKYFSRMSLEKHFCQ
jgi:hypothetical protein